MSYDVLSKLKYPMIVATKTQGIYKVRDNKNLFMAA